MFLVPASFILGAASLFYLLVVTVVRAKTNTRNFYFVPSSPQLSTKKNLNIEKEMDFVCALIRTQGKQRFHTMLHSLILCGSEVDLVIREDCQLFCIVCHERGYKPKRKITRAFSSRLNYSPINFFNAPFLMRYIV